ncbi:hypothetical protein AYI68_g3511 [Smittium mucronatum]|uniref:Retrotransposon gag domain-containing protein n=1 Tax=Smittium mucronatum TaxID=133383 RepID=A0A1R0GZQ5_9FUNG|nr:hypothetical protein AYI68_g3511 [Smittium mucronatum]
MNGTIKLPEATKFSVMVGKYQSFMASMEFYFWDKPETLANERIKIIFLCTNLRGPAENWFGTLLTSKSRCVYSYSSLEDVLKKNLSGFTNK